VPAEARTCASGLCSRARKRNNSEEKERKPTRCAGKTVPRIPARVQGSFLLRLVPWSTLAIPSISKRKTRMRRNRVLLLAGAGALASCIEYRRRMEKDAEAVLRNGRGV